MMKSICLLLCLIAAQHACAFTLWGPVETWQTTAMDYSNPAGIVSPRYYYWSVDTDTGLDFYENGTPKNFGEGSRLTTPILTYGFDDSFLEYFGTKGVAAVESAFAVLNALPSASSANLTNFLTTSAQQINYTAQALNLLDLKSTVLWMMVEHMGLLGETHVWDLLARQVILAPCDIDYYVVNRNYDPGDYNPTPYVNGRLYGYKIWDGCASGVAVGDAVEVTADTTAPRYTAVATGQGIQFGGFYLGLTRDDMGGLQNLYRKGNYAYQALDSNSVVTPFESSWMPVNTTNVITGISNFAGLLGGVEKITFVKVNFDSVLNPGFTPVTYTYTVPYVTNYRLSQLKVTRTITAPDILFTAADTLANTGAATATIYPGPELPPIIRTGSFLANPYAPLAPEVTPTTINPIMFITNCNVGPIYFNANPSFMDSADYFSYPLSNWGSFDGSTNPPVVFPDGFSLAELESEVLQGGPTAPFNVWAPVLNNSTNTTTTTSVH